ncbi:probable G-protein coupled receptor No18 [Watersipora subatra]|uniref:probable G-protein coupled receptor No18 n=1 Tax=Watersipora subatra TaxID=2589382 RepID=UPI00355B7E97
MLGGANETNMTMGRKTMFAYSLNGPAANIVLIITFAIIIAWTIIGNVTVILSVKRTPALRACLSNVLIANLACSDLLLGIVVLPLSAMVEVFNYWPLPQGLCFFWLVIDVLLCTASIWGLVTIATDRYTATFYPLWYRTGARKPRVVIYITIVWVTSIFTIIPVLFGFGGLLQNSYQEEIEPATCALDVTIDYALYSSIMTFFLPALILFILYGKIFREIRRRTLEAAKVRGKFMKTMKVEDKESHKIEQELKDWEHEDSTSQNEESSFASMLFERSENENPEKLTISQTIEDNKLNAPPAAVLSVSEEPSSQKNISLLKRIASKRKKEGREERATRIMLTIMLFFIICWLPFFIMYLTRAALSKTCADCIPLPLQSFLIWLGYINSAGNPILYAAFNRQFKDAFITIWCGKLYELCHKPSGLEYRPRASTFTKN